MCCKKCKWFEEYLVKGIYVECCGFFQKELGSLASCSEYEEN